MATFDATTSAVMFAHMEGATQTVYAVPRSPAYDSVTSGDRFEFDRVGSITIGAVRRYVSLRELLEFEGFQNVVPDAETIEEAEEAIRKSPDWDRRVEEARGVMGLRVRSTKRKA
jgi:ASC-1-like (ASCH) protein